MSKRKTWRQQQKENRKEAQREKQRLKALPKPLRKLETDLGFYVDFMDVYDGYIGDFTGVIIPAKPVENPFVIINKMGLNFPHPNALNIEQKNLYIEKISETFERIGFYIEYLSDDLSKNYELLLFYIENYEKQAFDTFTSNNYNDISLIIKRIDYNNIY